MAGTAADANLVLEASSPDVRVVVSVTSEQVAVHDRDAPGDAVVLRGDAVKLIEMLSARVPFDGAVAVDQTWLVRSLAEVFEV